MSLDEYLKNPPQWFLDAVTLCFRFAFVISVLEFVKEGYRPDDAYNRVYLNAVKLGLIKPKLPCLIY